MIEDQISLILETRELEEEILEVREVHSIIQEINIGEIIDIDILTVEIKGISEILDMRGKHIIEIYK